MTGFHFHHRLQQPESYGENIKYSDYWFDNPKLIEYPQVQCQWTKQTENEFFNFKFQKKKKAKNVKRFCQHLAFVKLVKIKALKRVFGKFQLRLAGLLITLPKDILNHKWRIRSVLICNLSKMALLMYIFLFR